MNGIVLRDARSRSCGCLKRDVVSARSTKHGHATNGLLSSTYHSWVAMVQRCTNPKNKHYSDYGGRGIRICARWKNSFQAFLEDMGEKPIGTSIERANNSGHYEVGNCYWASPIRQANNKRNNRVIAYRGRKQTLTEWARELGLGVATLAERLEKWPIQRALTEGPHLTHRVSSGVR